MTNKQTPGVFVTHSECLSEDCNSSDAMAIHAQVDGTYDAYCWSCDGYFNWDKLKEGGWIAEDLNNKPRGKTKRPPITKEEILSLKNETVIDPTLYRGLKTEHNKFYGVRTKLVNGKVTERHYPVTKDGKPSGYKKRVHPKDFTQGYLGYNGQDCDLFGAVRFPKGGKYILLASGEEDTVAAFQMLRDDQLRRNKAAYQPVAVVGSTVGENCVKQIKNNYEYLTSFEKIIVCPDQDDAGLKAVEKILQVLPPDKTFVMQSPEKDANKCIDEKREVEFVRAFYSAIKHNPAGIVGSGDLMGKIVEYAKLPRLSLPPFLSSLQKMQAGGIPLGTIINFASGSGCVDKDTEFLTPTGWKKIDEYEQGDHVGQYEKDGKLRFVEPKEYIKQPAESLWSIQSKYGVDMCLSDEHRVIYRPRSINGKLKERTLKEVREIHDKVKYGFRGDFETTFDFSGPGINIPEGELRLQVAVMADGRIVREGKDNYCQMRFAKERKYDRLLAICKEYGLRHDDRGWKPHDRYLSGKIYEVIVWPKWADKNFDSKYYSCSKEQLEIILDELLYWDGYFGSMQYTTTDKQDADFIQFAYAATGRRATISVDHRKHKYSGGYCAAVYATGNKRVGISRGGESEKIPFKPYKTLDGYKYCFVVDSGMLVLRRNNKIFITGNSGKTTLINEILYHWLFHSEYRMGVCPLEGGLDYFGESMLSRHLGNKIALISDPKQKVEYLQNPAIKEKADELFYDNFGGDRFELIDGQGVLDIETFKKQAEYLVRAKDVRVIVVDTLTKLVEGESTDRVYAMMKWQNDFVIQNKCIIINICQVRKSPSGKKGSSTGANIDEESISGLGVLLQTAACNLLFMRNKEAEDDIERNSTKLVQSKCRWSGVTGSAGWLYYDNETHTLHNKDSYFADTDADGALSEQEEQFQNAGAYEDTDKHEF